MDLQENPAVADIKARQAADRRVSLSPKECQIEALGREHLSGEGRQRRSASIPRRGARADHRRKFLCPPDRVASGAPDKKVRQPASRFQKIARPRTEAELEGLRKGQ